VDDLDLVRRWIDAYSEGRDDDLLQLAHPEIVVRPRRGHGAAEYQGIDGVRRWLADIGTARPEPKYAALERLATARVIAAALFDGVEVTALFDIRDRKIFTLSVYLSDRRTLDALGIIDERSRA
jgi:hypothetical protein